MRSRTRAFLASAAVLPLAACPAQQASDTGGEASAGAEAAALESEQDKTIYAMGYFVMQRAGNFQLDPAEQDLAVEGARDALAGREPRVDVAQYQNKIAELYKERQAAGAAEEKAASAEWVAELAEEPGAVTTESGLVFMEQEPGEGARPEPDDTVRVHYHGTLRDGTVFDSSRERGQPAVFPLNRVIPCWTEALQRMSVGGKATVVCPSALAYGDTGAPPRIDPGAALKFEIELLDIVEN